MGNSRVFTNIDSTFFCSSCLLAMYIFTQKSKKFVSQSVWLTSLLHSTINEIEQTKWGFSLVTFYLLTIPSYQFFPPPP